MCEHSQEQFNCPIYINHMVNTYITISHSKVNHMKQKSEQAIKFLLKGSKKQTRVNYDFACFVLSEQQQRHIHCWNPSCVFILTFKTVQQINIVF